MSIDNRGRMLCNHCGRFMGFVAAGEVSERKLDDECHNCRSRRLRREAKDEAPKSH